MVILQSLFFKILFQVDTYLANDVIWIFIILKFLSIYFLNAVYILVL